MQMIKDELLDIEATHNYSLEELLRELEFNDSERTPLYRWLKQAQLARAAIDSFMEDTREIRDLY